MSPKHLGAFILLLLVTVLPSCTTQYTYYVKPTPDTPCHEDPCHTLSEYVSESERYFTFNTTIVFLPGEHVLQQNVTVTNVGRLAFIGNFSSSPANASRIICTDATLTFTSIGTLEIADLDFHSCTIRLNTSSAVFNKSSFENSTSSYGGAIYTQRSTIVFDRETRFEGNRAAVAGGGLFAEESSLTFHGNTTFSNNEAFGSGGGIYMIQGIVKFTGNASFISNIVHWFGGGGIYGNNSRLDFDFENTLTFLDNSAVMGGGLLVNNCTVSFSGVSLFINNSAEIDGGGVYVEQYSTVSLGDDSIFIENSALRGGGVLVWRESKVSFGDSNRFLNNSVLAFGGGLYVHGSKVSFGDDSTFIDNSAVNGGGVYVLQGSTVSFGDDSRFIDNSADNKGGGVTVNGSTVSFGNDSRFIENSAREGGGVYVLEGSVRFGNDSDFTNNSAVRSDNSIFNNNSAGNDGGGVTIKYSTVSFGDGSKFIDNSADDDAGGVYIEASTVSFGDSSRFIDNSAEDDGGGVHVERYSTVSFGDSSRFIKNSAEDNGGGVHVEASTVSFGYDSRFIDNTAFLGGGVVMWYSTVHFGDSDFTGNSADYYGGCMAALLSSIIIMNVGGSSHFMNNSARYGGCISVDRCNLIFSKTIIFSGNSAIANNWRNGESGATYGGAIFAKTSNLTFDGSQVLTNNSAGYGGAVYLSVDSKIYHLPKTIMSFERNSAQYRGGAIFFEDNTFNYCIIDPAVQARIVLQTCFIQSHVYQADCIPLKKGDWTDLDQSIKLRFQDNAANEAGSAIYGGNLDSCGVCTLPYEYYQYVTGEVAFSVWGNISGNLTSSDPYRVCICVDNHPVCNESKTTCDIFPGVTIDVAIVAVGQLNGPVPAVIHTYISEGITLGALQSTQQSNNTCTRLEFTVRSTRDINIWSEATLTLYADEPCSTLGVPHEILLTFLPCPLGFSLSSEGGCECDQRLNEYQVYCDINDQSILRKDSVWIGFNERSDNQSQGLILHPHCPFDYCKRESDSVIFTMNSTNLQCNYNRSGHLCGACQHGFSLAVGSSRCLQCSNKFITLLFPFAFGGLALVVFLFICKVTVAAGTISGLIFYANVVRVNQSIFFPSGETNVLTVFIAWLNLDLGIETCFFDGMDMYSKTWLQFVFPIYIWLLVGLITILCKVSTTATKILGSTNPIAVLATLFLLSFTKLLRTTIAAFSFTILEYPDGETKVVWLYDGNIGYLDLNDGRNIALFLASLLVILFFFLPYTIFLLLGQCILPRLDLNKLRWLSSANYLQMKSFLDAYHAPYKDRHRYWIGLLLVLRFVMFMTSAIVDIESPQDPHVNLLVIIACTFLLAMWVWNASGGVYKKWYINVLESSFIFNLATLAAATLYVKLAGGNQAGVFYTSVSVAFSAFIGIVIYQVYQQLMDSRAWRNLVRKRNDRRASGHGWRREDAAADEEMEEMLPQVPPTVTYVEIPTEERRQMRPITPPLSSTNLTDVPEPFDHLQREVAAADEDSEVEEMLPQVAPTVTAAKAMCPLTPPPLPTKFTELREPLDLLTQ